MTTAMPPSTGMFGAGLYRKTSDSNPSDEGERGGSGEGSAFRGERRAGGADLLATATASQRPEDRWSRRAIQAAVAADRERAQLLRTISHLNKTQQPEVHVPEGAEEVAGGHTAAGSSADTAMPPQYQERSRGARSLDLGRRIRGLSASEGSGANTPTTSARHPEEDDPQTSFALTAAGIGSLGRAKAAQARAKLRRFSISQLSLSAVSASSSHTSTPTPPSPAVANYADVTTPTSSARGAPESSTVSTKKPRTVISGADAPVGTSIMLQKSLASADASAKSVGAELQEGDEHRKSHEVKQSEASVRHSGNLGEYLVAAFIVLVLARSRVFSGWGEEGRPRERAVCGLVGCRAKLDRAIIQLLQ